MEQLNGKLFEKADFFGLFDHPLGLSQLREDFEVIQHAIPLLNNIRTSALSLISHSFICLRLNALKLFDNLLAEHLVALADPKDWQIVRN